MDKAKFLLIFVIFLLPSITGAHDFGKQGVMVPILELNLLAVLKTRISELQQTGYFKKLAFAYQNQMRKEMDRPGSVTDITTTVNPKSWFYDPSILMPQNLYSPFGTLIVKAGEKYNPLQTIHLGEVLLFYNADDLNQVKWAKQEEGQFKGRDKLILVNGSVLTQRSEFKKPIYFDQLGLLTTRFHIQHVPAIVKQVGLRLKVSEVLP